MPTVDNNTNKFRQLVKQYSLSLAAIASISGRSYQRVKDWHSGKYHQIPTDTLSLLEYRLKELRDKGQL